MRKMDEMEKSITLKAIKWSWFFTLVSLLIWSAYETIVGNVFSIANIIVSMQIIIYFIILQINKLKVVDENNGKKGLFSLIIFIIFLIVFGIILFILSNKGIL